MMGCFNGVKGLVQKIVHKPKAQTAQEKSQSSPQFQIKDTATTLDIAFKNTTSSGTVYAYVTGLAIDNKNAWMLLEADGKTVYYPSSPSATGASLGANCSIPLGAPGSTITVTIPRIAGGRIWFSIDAQLTFLLNPGPALVEPSVTNTGDPNYNINWTFCELTFNSAQLFANISGVDFVGVPVGLSLTNTSGATQTVQGLPSDSLATIANGLRTQASSDGQPWDQLVYTNNGSLLRVISPNSLLVGSPNAFSGYWDSYVSEVWSRFSSQQLTVNTQASYGNLSGSVSNGKLSLGDAGTFSQPSAADIFSCSTGPFATGSNAARNAVIPRLAAAFNRSLLLTATDTPNGSNPSQYYQNATTNHYARIVHQASRDGQGYAFPYDDVTPDGGTNVAGVVNDGSPSSFTITVGGG